MNITDEEYDFTEASDAELKEIGDFNRKVVADKLKTNPLRIIKSDDDQGDQGDYPSKK